MDIKDFAKMLDGRQYMDEMTADEEKIASENGFVVVFGYSDDNCELRGAVRDEIGCYDGGVIRAKGLPKPINAIWCPADKECSWSYETDMPHEEFNIFDGDELFCVGIVVDIKAARSQMTEHERLVELLSECKPIMERILDDDWYENEISDIADYLLEHSVIIPPVEIGDTIYIVDENSNEFTGIDECHVRKLEWNGVFWAIFNDKDCYGYSEDYIGKTIFFTKEEAEAALKEMEGVK